MIHFVLCSLYEDAAKIAFEQKDLQALMFVQGKCAPSDRTLSEKICLLVSQLSSKKWKGNSDILKLVQFFWSYVHLVRTCILLSFFHIIGNLQLRLFTYLEDNCFSILNSNQLKCCIMHCGDADWCHRCAIWWSAYILFNERTSRLNFKIHNVLCVFMDKYFFLDY